MAYKSILVQADSEDIADARVACAADLADRFDTVLRGLGAGFLKPIGVVAPYNAYEAALPLLKHAEDVVVLEVFETADMEGAEHRTLQVAPFHHRKPGQ